MDSKWNFQLTQKAETDLDEIVSYMAEDLSNPQAASDFLDGIEKVIAEACSFPESGLPVDNGFLTDAGVRKKLVGHYILYYFPDTDAKCIYVVRVIYGKRNLEEIMEKLGI